MTINEADTRAELIDPKPKAADWGVEADGSICRKLAAVEAKKESLSYTERLQCRMAYATNVHEIYQIDMYRGKFNTLGELKKSILQKAFIGELT